MRISDWSSDVCSSDLAPGCGKPLANLPAPKRSKLAAMLGVLLDMSLKGRFIRDSRRRAIDIGCGPLVDRLPEPPTGCDPEPVLHRDGAESSEESLVGKEGVSTCRSRWCR